MLMLVWKFDSFPRKVQYDFAAIQPMVAEMEEGFLRYPWGGLESGGILLGNRLPDRVEILAYREFPCEHEYGPSWELSAKEIATADRIN